MILIRGMVLIKRSSGISYSISNLFLCCTSSSGGPRRHLFHILHFFFGILLLLLHHLLFHLFLLHHLLLLLFLHTPPLPPLNNQQRLQYGTPPITLPSPFPPCPPFSPVAPIFLISPLHHKDRQPFRRLCILNVSPPLLLLLLVLFLFADLNGLIISSFPVKRKRGEKSENISAEFWQNLRSFLYNDFEKEVFMLKTMVMMMTLPMGKTVRTNWLLDGLRVICLVGKRLATKLSTKDPA